MDDELKKPEDPDATERLADVQRRRDATTAITDKLFKPRPRKQPLPARQRPKRTEPLHLRPPPMYRYYRPITYEELPLALSWLEPLGLRREEFVAYPHRSFVVQRVKDEIVGIGVFERYPPVGVIRAIAISPTARRLTHGSYLVQHLMVQHAHKEKLTVVFVPGLHRMFLEQLGFAVVQRAGVPEHVRRSAGFADATVPIYAMDVRPDGVLRPYNRRLPKTVVELIARQERQRAREERERAKQEREQRRGG